MPVATIEWVGNLRDGCARIVDQTLLPEIQRLAGAAVKAADQGMKVAAGHGLDYPNTESVAAIPAVEELNIGHAIVSRAAMVGMDQAVRDMLAIIKLAAYS